MKKTYIRPNMEVVKAQTESILEVSATGTGVFGTSASSSNAVLTRERGTRTTDDFDELW